MTLYFHPDAETELTEAAIYYGEARMGLAESFISEVERTADFITRHPSFGVLVAEDNIRRVRVRRFPYSLIYRVLSDRVRILAVAHHRRQPLYWYGRQ